MKKTKAQGKWSEVKLGEREEFHSRYTSEFSVRDAHRYGETSIDLLFHEGTYTERVQWFS